VTAEQKQAAYQARRSAWTEGARNELLAQREYEVLWGWIVCGHWQQWTAKHG